MQCILYKIYFWKFFSYVLQIDMHFICTPMWTKFYSCKKWVLHKTSSREQGPWFDLVGTSWTVVTCETRGATRMMCQSSSCPAGCTPTRITVTLSDMSDRLLLLSYHSMYCCIDGMD
jgi:hypothetical protein